MKTVNSIKTTRGLAEQKLASAFLAELAKPNGCQFVLEKSLAFRGTKEFFGSSHNGNFMGGLELLAEDNLVALHFKYDQARRRFVEWAQNEIAVVPDFHKRILFSDEAHFWLNDYVNKQNCRIWSEANPQVYVETPLHPEKLTVLLQKR
ncbi:hypothetical protein TNCV_768051 [Trichonephila clavipes]|nr:hypothetical protein TNCV_768051 [Trichonephila clavipes]